MHKHVLKSSAFFKLGNNETLFLCVWNRTNTTKFSDYIEVHCLLMFKGKASFHVVSLLNIGSLSTWINSLIKK